MNLTTPTTIPTESERAAVDKKDKRKNGDLRMICMLELVPFYPSLLSDVHHSDHQRRSGCESVRIGQTSALRVTTFELAVRPSRVHMLSLLY
jgi:hypothetical protein